MLYDNINKLREYLDFIQDELRKELEVAALVQDLKLTEDFFVFLRSPLLRQLVSHYEDVVKFWEDNPGLPGERVKQYSRIAMPCTEETEGE